MLERLFQLKAHNTNVRTEILAGITTFLAMAYILFVPKAFTGYFFGLDLNPASPCRSELASRSFKAQKIARPARSYGLGGSVIV